MREILFRGKRIDNGEWVEGYLVNGTYYLDDSNRTAIIPVDTTFFPRCEITGWERVNPETVGQFTGLLDKNGKKIFEGDIVTVSGHLDYVIFAEGCFCMARQCYCYEFTYQDGRHIEIIGNVHDSPELLEVPNENPT